MTSRVLFRSKVRFPSRVRFHFAVGILPLILLFIGLCGCPDRSYQAPLPDYSTMTDGGGENSEDAESID